MRSPQRKNGSFSGKKRLANLHKKHKHDKGLASPPSGGSKVVSQPFTPHDAVGWKVKIWWGHVKMSKFYKAIVLSYDGRAKKHKLKYAIDGVEQTLRLMGPKAETLCWLEPPATVEIQITPTLRVFHCRHSR